MSVGHCGNGCDFDPKTGAHVPDGCAKAGCWCAEQGACKPITSTPTESILGEAHRVVNGPRSSYGHPLDNHGATAAMLRAFLHRKYGVDIPLVGEDICWFNILQKASREANEESRDSLVDVAGYAHNIELIRGERDRREKSNGQ